MPSSKELSGAIGGSYYWAALMMSVNRREIKRKSTSRLVPGRNRVAGDTLMAEYQRVLSVDKRFDVLVLDRQFSKRRSYQGFDLCASAFQPSPKRKDWFFIGSLGVRNWSGVKPIGRHMYE